MADKLKQKIDEIDNFQKVSKKRSQELLLLLIDRYRHKMSKNADLSLIMRLRAQIEILLKEK